MIGLCSPVMTSDTPAKSRCSRHGGTWSNGGCVTLEVLAEVREERARQFARYGDNAQLEFGNGPETRWLLPLSNVSAEGAEVAFREDYEAYEEETGNPTWVHLVREEIGEAFKEDNIDRLAEELVQVAALCVSWVEKIRG